MILYLCIIGIAMVIIISFNILFNLTKFAISPTYVVLGTILGVIFSIAIDGLVAFLIRQIPEKKFNPFTKYFCEGKHERKFYEKTNIRNWKDLIPELGKTLKYFDKTQVSQKPTVEYMLKFLKETCYAEVMHLAIIPAAFLLGLILPFKYFWCLSFPIILVNIFLQILPIFVQRYTRPKLVKAYQRMLKYENLNTEKQEKPEEKPEEKENKKVENESKEDLKTKKAEETDKKSTVKTKKNKTTTKEGDK